MRAEVDAIWAIIPPWVWPLVSLLLMPLLLRGYKWLRHRHLKTELDNMDGMRLTLKVSRKETAKLEQTKAALVARHLAGLPHLIQQYRVAPPDEVERCLSRLSEWLSDWRESLGNNAAHLAMALLTPPDGEENQGLRVALLAAALGNRNAADLLIESEVVALAQSDCLGGLPLDQAWERLFAVIRPSRQSDLIQQSANANRKGARAYDLADYPLAGRWLRFALYLDETLYSSDHLDVATSLNNLAALYQKQGRYAQAEPLCTRSLAIREQALGPDHLDVAMSLNDRAALYQAQGQYAQAEPLLKRSLVIREQALGPDHPDVAMSLNNLAILHEAQGQYTQAEPLYKRSLAILEQALSSNHPDVATSLNNLAALYHSQGQYAQAEPLYKRSLVIREQALGSDHPDVATSLNNLAMLSLIQGQHAPAELFYKRALVILEQALGWNHPGVATSLNNLAGLYHTQGQYAQAEPLYKRSLAIREQSLGSNHPDVATSLGNVAALYRNTGREKEAEALEERAVAIRAIKR